MEDTCQNGVCHGVPLDADGDGTSPIACHGSDCDDEDPALSINSAEGLSYGSSCEDGRDNDCDGLADQLDSDCVFPQLVDAPVTDNRIYALAESNGLLYLAGSFSRLSQRTGGFVATASDSGERYSRWPEVTGDVMAAEPDGNGGWYIGGFFSHVNGVPRSSLAHLLPDGRLSDWNPNFTSNNSINAIAVTPSLVYVGGAFNLTGEKPRKNLAVFDRRTGALTDIVANTDLEVVSLASGGTRVYLAGFFSKVNGENRMHLAALDAATGQLLDWSPNPDQLVKQVVVAGGQVFVRGLFSQVAGQNRRYLASFDFQTGSLTEWNPEPDKYAAAMAATDSTLYVGGAFTRIGGVTRNRLAEIDLNTLEPTSWDPGVDNLVNAIAADATTVFITGDFTNVAGVRRTKFAAIDAGSANVTSWIPAEPNGEVVLMQVAGDKILMAGHFSGMGGEYRERLAAIDMADLSTTDWQPSADNTVYAIEVVGQTMIIGGFFTRIAGEEQHYLAKLDARTGTLIPWNIRLDGGVQMLSVRNGIVYLSGTFTNINGEPRDGLGAVNLDDGTLTPWNPELVSNPRSIVLNLNATEFGVLIGGTFETIGGQPRRYLAAVDPISGAVLDWNPNPNSWVWSTCADDGVIYAGGMFTGIGGEERHSFAGLDPATGLATEWDPGFFFSSRVYRIESHPRFLFLIGNVSAPGWFRDVIAFDKENWLWLPWNPSPGSPPALDQYTCSEVSDDHFFIGGNFYEMAGRPARGLAVFRLH
jgi:predicted small secreted protein